MCKRISSAALLIAALILLSPAWGQQDKPSPFGQSKSAAVAGSEESVDNSTALTPARDPFPEELSAIQQTELEWRSAKNKLEDIGTGCTPNGTQIIDRAKVTKLRSVAAYAAYYQKTVGYWAKIRDASGEAEISGRSEAAELRAHKNQLERELGMIVSRKADLERSLEENQVNRDRKALDDLAQIEEHKREEVDKAGAALEQNDTGRGYILKRREYAKERMDEANELLQSLRTETYLYQQLYNTILYRHSLTCDGDVPRPQSFPSDWREDVKKLGSKGPGGN
jgi:hypothetical protein